MLAICYLFYLPKKHYEKTLHKTGVLKPGSTDPQGVREDRMEMFYTVTVKNLYNYSA